MAFTLQPAVGESFVNRRAIVEEMVSTLSDKNLLMGFALVGNRRMGKSSIFQEVCRELTKKKDIIPVYFSSWSLIEKSVEEFCRSLAFLVLERYKQKLSLRYRIKDLVKVPVNKLFDFLRTIDVRIKILEEIEISLSTREGGEDLSLMLEQALSLPENLASETDTRCILFLDEFPSVIELASSNGRMIGEQIIRKIRTIQENYRQTVLCISGSIKKSMELAALSSASPFYRQFIVKNVEAFRKADLKELLETNLRTKLPEEVINTCYQLSGGIPFYIQFIGRCLLKLGRKKITSANTFEIFDELLREEGNLLFTQEFNSFSSRERKVLVTMAKNNLYKLNEIAKYLRQGLNVVGRYLEYLVKKGVITKENRGIYKFIDPVFEKWVKEILVVY